MVVVYETGERMKRLIVLLTACGLSSALFAQGYPAKLIKIVVPFAAGGTADISARGIAAGLSAVLGQNVIVENRLGAGGTIGAEYSAKSAPDGYSLLLGSNSTLSVAPALYKNIRYDPINDFSPVTLIATTPMVLAIHPSVPAKNLREFIAIAKSGPGRLTMASGGIGSMNQMAGELFQSLSGVKFTHVPFKGSAPAVVALISGEVDMLFDQLATSVSQITSGKLRALGISASARHPLLPKVPTMLEAGVPNYEVISITGLLAPSGTPKEIVDKLNAAAVNVLKANNTKARFAAFGLDAQGSTPEEFASFIKSDLAKWTRIVKEANIVVE
jgi:tripartite-type tricarboxylate transporter receptor subunit TctC